MDDPIKRMLAELRAGYTDADARAARQDAAVAHVRETVALAREAERTRRQREVLASRAREYLARLDPRSREGRWFADFATHYATPLEAAMVCVAAQDEVERP